MLISAFRISLFKWVSVRANISLFSSIASSRNTGILFWLLFGKSPLLLPIMRFNSGAQSCPCTGVCLLQHIGQLTQESMWLWLMLHYCKFLHHCVVCAVVLATVSDAAFVQISPSMCCVCAVASVSFSVLTCVKNYFGHVVACRYCGGLCCPRSVRYVWCLSLCSIVGAGRCAVLTVCYRAFPTVPCVVCVGR